MEFAGCLYETPTPDGGEREWVVDSTTGQPYPFDLTVSEIKNMAIVGVPIKIEHTMKGFEAGDEVGRVVDTCVDPKTGYTACKFELHDTGPGRVLRQLIDNKTVDSLSLGHLYHRDQKTVEAQEVSVCFKGARSGTRLYKQLADFDVLKAKYTAPDAETAETTKTSGAMDATATDEKPIASPDVNTSAEAAPADGSLNSLDIIELLAKCTEGQPDELANALYSRVADISTQLSSSTKASEAQKASIAELTTMKTKLEKEKESASELNTKKAKECVNVMNALLAEYVGDSSSISDSGDDASMLEAAHRIPVLASALASRKMVNTLVSSNEAMRQTLERQIKNALGPTMPTVWQAPDAHVAPSYMPQAVQASANHHTTQHEPPAKRSRFYGLSEGQQRALSDIGDFSANGDKPVTKQMFSNNFKGKAFAITLFFLFFSFFLFLSNFSKCLKFPDICTLYCNH
jgi:hypothetical protein